MKKTIIIRDYAGDSTAVTIEDFETVGKIYIEIITGDEILHVIRKDLEEEVYDSSNSRIMNFADGCYDVYWPGKGINLLDNPKWYECEDSYDRQKIAIGFLFRMFGDYEEGA